MSQCLCFNGCHSLSEVDRGFECGLGQTRYYSIKMVFDASLTPKHAALGSKSKDGFPLNQDNVTECNDMGICEVFFR